MTTTYAQGQELWAWTNPDDPEGVHYLATSREEAIADAEEDLDPRDAIAVYPATVPRYVFDGADELARFLEDGEEAGDDLLLFEEDAIWHALPGAAEALEAALKAWAETYLRVATARIDPRAGELVRKATRDDEPGT